jgi:hypothetical protein
VKKSDQSFELAKTVGGFAIGFIAGKNTDPVINPLSLPISLSNEPVEMDEDVLKVAEYMQATFSADRLIGVANGISAVAPMLWARYGQEKVNVLAIVSEPITSDCDRHTQSSAN